MILNRQAISSALKLSLPVMFGYVPLGMAFGVLFVTQLDYAWWYAPFLSIFVYAGAAQILAVSLIGEQMNIFSVFIAIFVLNSRHIFYGMSLLEAFSGAGWRKFYLIFALTDETYSLLTARERSQDKKFEIETDFYISLFNQSYWILGSVLGAYLTSELPFNSNGIEYALIALFVVLALEQFKLLQAKFAIYAGALASVIALAFFPAEHQLVLAIILVILAIWYQFKKKPKIIEKT